MGVAPRRLNGWETTETTEHVYEDGLLVRSTTTREPEFDAEQLDLLLASAEFEASIGSNGFLRSDAMNPEADIENYNSPLRFSSTGPFWDYAEKARLDAVASYREQYPKANLNGAYWVVEKHGESSSGEMSEPAE